VLQRTCTEGAPYQSSYAYFGKYSYICMRLHIHICKCKCIYTHKPDDTPCTLTHMHARTNTHATHTNLKTRTNAHTQHIHACHTPQTNTAKYNHKHKRMHIPPPYIVLSISSNVYVPCHTRSLRRRSYSLGVLVFAGAFVRDRKVYYKTTTNGGKR